MKAAIALLCLGLSACAGTSHYTVEPFYEPTTQKLVCCRAEAFSGKDVNALTFDLSMQPNNTVTVHFSESGVGATAPLTAQGAVISNVAGAVSSAAAAAIKLAP